MHASLKEKLEELSGGTITYECVFGGALGNNTQLLAQLKQGTLDLMPTGFDLATNLPTLKPEQMGLLEWHHSPT